MVICWENEAQVDGEKGWERELLLHVSYLFKNIDCLATSGSILCETIQLHSLAFESL